MNLVQKYYNEASSSTVAILSSMTVEEKSEKCLILPHRTRQIRQVFACLCGGHGIVPEVVSAFIRKGMIYESSKPNSVVFLGLDRNGKPQHAHKYGTNRGSTYKRIVDGSNPAYSFHYNGRSNRLFLFETPIDMLSYISMNLENWEEHSYAASCSESDCVLWQMLENNPKLNTVCLCRNNNQSSQEANQRTAIALKATGNQYRTFVPSEKDWNKDLRHYLAMRDARSN